MKITKLSKRESNRLYMAFIRNTMTATVPHGFGLKIPFRNYCEENTGGNWRHFVNLDFSNN